MPPYPLPDHQTRSVIRSESTPGDDPQQSNELYFEDQAGSEDIYFHAQKDFHRVVENHDDLQVHNDQTINIATNTTTTAGESIVLSVGENSIRIDETGVTITAAKVMIQSMMIDMGEGEFNFQGEGFDVEAMQINMEAPECTINMSPAPYVPIPVE
jgi:hypothetical protein